MESRLLFHNGSNNNNDDDDNNNNNNSNNNNSKNNKDCDKAKIHPYKKFASYQPVDKKPGANIIKFFIRCQWQRGKIS